MINVSIILVNWNGKNDTLACLGSLHASTHQRINASTIVVDNGSTDDSVIAIHRKFPDVEVIENRTNLGFAGGNNVGIRRAFESRADYVWLLNNDTIVDKNALVMLVDAMKGDRVGVTGSKIYFAPRREYHKERYIKEDRGHVLWYAGGVIDWKNMYAAHRGVDEVDRGQYDRTEETPFVTGCSMMVKKEAVNAVGMLDEKLFMYFEDVDLCLRAKYRGWRCVYVPGSIVWHVNAGSSGRPGSRLHEYYQTRNRLIMGMRYAPIRTKLSLLREGMRFIMIGSSVRRKAIVDALTLRMGKQEFS